MAKKPAPTFQVRLKGKGMSPEIVSIGRMNDLLAALQTLSRSEIRLIDVKRGSTVYQFYANDEELTLRSLATCGKAISNPGEFLHRGMVKAFDKLSSVIEKLSCYLMVETEKAAWKEWKLENDQWEEIKTDFIVADESIVYGEVVRVGGASGKRCTIRTSDSKLLYCNVSSDEVARDLGGYLYKKVDLHGRGLYFIRDWSIISFTVYSFNERKPSSFEEAYRDMRSAGGEAWDGIQDSQQFLKDLR